MRGSRLFKMVPTKGDIIQGTRTDEVGRGPSVKKGVGGIVVGFRLQTINKPFCD